MEQRTPDGKRTKQRLLEQAAQTLIAALLLGSASGCATMDYGDRYDRPPEYRARSSQASVRVVQVLPGDTVEDVARRFNVSEQAIIDANNLEPPYRFRRSRSIVLPAPSDGRSSRHVVASGETVNSIARSYGVSPSAIIELNELRDPNALRPGDRLSIPRGGERQYARAEPRPPRADAAIERSELPPPKPARSAAPAEASGVDPRLAGARYYNSGLPRPKPGTGEGGPEFASARDVAPADPRDEAYVAPRPKPRRAAIAAAPARDDDQNDEAFDSPRRAKPRQYASVDPDDEAFDPSRRAKPAAPASPKASSRFVWPVHGAIISGFGRRASGVHNDGINIAAEPGSSVKAADAGVVVYAGNELAGYGNLLLIRHANGFVTAYAHNKKLLVGKGDTVRQGQAIALVGSTGDVDRPQLHFEIRKGDRAVDPNRYLDTANASL